MLLGIHVLKAVNQHNNHCLSHCQSHSDMCRFDEQLDTLCMQSLLSFIQLSSSETPIFAYPGMQRLYRSYVIHLLLQFFRFGHWSFRDIIGHYILQGQACQFGCQNLRITAIAWLIALVNFINAKDKTFDFCMWIQGRWTISWCCATGLTAINFKRIKSLQ